MSSALSRIGPSEAQSMAVYGNGHRPASLPMYRELRESLAWFRAEWEAAIAGLMRLHEGADQIASEDALGGPRWTHRFETFLLEPPRAPLRIALAGMASGSLLERVGARFLFALACHDFDARAAGLALAGCNHEPRHRPCPDPALPLPPEYVGYYAEKAIARLRERIERLPARERPTGARIVEQPEWVERVSAVADSRAQDTRRQQMWRKRGWVGVET